MGREWVPGDVAMVTAEFRRGVVDSAPARRTSNAYAGWDRLTDSAFVEDRQVQSARPLAVIDPEQIMVDGTFERDHLTPDMLSAVLTNIANHLDENDNVPSWTAVLRALSAAVHSTPPRPDEPLGLGAVVEDAEGQLWIRTADSRSGAPWSRRNLPGAALHRAWHELSPVRVLSEGVRDV